MPWPIAQASARPVAGMAVGQQADFMELDAQHLLVRDLPSPEAMLSAHVFASHRQSALLQVWVRGRLRVQSGRHALHESALRGGVAARQQLLKKTP